MCNDTLPNTAHPHLSVIHSLMHTHLHIHTDMQVIRHKTLCDEMRGTWRTSFYRGKAKCVLEMRFRPGQGFCYCLITCQKRIWIVSLLICHLKVSLSLPPSLPPSFALFALHTICYLGGWLTHTFILCILNISLSVSNCIKCHSSQKNTWLYTHILHKCRGKHLTTYYLCCTLARIFSRQIQEEVFAQWHKYSTTHYIIAWTFFIYNYRCHYFPLPINFEAPSSWCACHYDAS